MVDDKIERIYTVPLGDAYEYIRTKRARRAVSILRQFLSRHMKAGEDDISISNKLNANIWERGIQKPPRRVKIRVIKQAGKVKAFLTDEKTEPEPKKGEPKKEELKKNDEKKQEIKKPEEKKNELKKEDKK